MSGEPPAGADAELDALDYYTLLGVEPDASRDEVRSAFRRFALRYHPDRFVDESPERQGRALAIYRRGAEAVDVLADHEQRQAYDAVRAEGKTRLTDDAAKTLARAPRDRAKAAPARVPAEGPSVKPPSAPPAAKAMPTFAKPGAGVTASKPRPARSSKPSRRGMAAAPKVDAPKVAPSVEPAKVAPKPAPIAEPVRTPQARAFLQRALDAKADGDLRTAWRMLKSAVDAEPDNPTLERELYAIERTFRP